METARSFHGFVIRLTEERWSHICTQHVDLANLRLEILRTISEPDMVLEGPSSELLAVSSVDVGKWLVVVYRIDEESADGFVITAYVTRRRQALMRWRQKWP